jgi:sporulation-control protein spo0M
MSDIVVTMSFFDKIKTNFKRGGIKVQLISPPAINASDTQMTVQVILTASDSPQQINKITVTLNRIDREENLTDRSAPDTVNRVAIAAVTHSVPMTIAPGSSQTVAIAMPLQLGGGPSGTMGKLIDFGNKLDQMMNMGQTNYEVTVSADVDGVSGMFDPGQKNVIQVLRSPQQPN